MNAKIKYCQSLWDCVPADQVQGVAQLEQEIHLGKPLASRRYTGASLTKLIMPKFTGRRALVTGAGAGIGRAIAIKLVEMGAEVFALSKTAAHLESLKAECPKVHITCVDLGDWTASREAVKKLTPIHLLVNNAACSALAPFLTASPESFDLLFNVNVKAVMNVSQVVAGDLVAREQRGSVVNLSSQAGQRALWDHTVYCSAKAALDMLTKVMALELGPKGIRVNAVSPTVVMTAMGRLGWSDPAKAGPMMDRIPQGRFAEVEDVVNAVVFLLSDESDMVNGHLLAVDGGFLAA
ncbi:L-xylulose reductase-like [Panulirus ornatus]|uniref:L-xylulose reductase-like n=1 Tax=Panulirus ornatus TaxID=150431 RepID=UPI003A83EC5F